MGKLLLLSVASLLACSTSSPAPRSDKTRAPGVETVGASPTTPESLAPGTPTPTQAPTPASISPAGDAADFSAVFEGRVLVAGGEVFCLTTFFDSSTKKAVHSVDLNSCSYSEDEVAVNFVDDGTPTKPSALAALSERADGCVENPRYLEMASWPDAARSMRVAGWKMTAILDGAGLSITTDDGLDRNFELPAGHRPISVHHDDELTVVRATGATGESSTVCLVER